MLPSTISCATGSRSKLQPAGRNGKSVCDLPLDIGARAAEQRAESSVEAELLPMRADEVEDGAGALPGGLAQASPELLEEERRAVGWAEEQKRVDVRNVDALVEEIDREDDAHLPVVEVAQRGPSLVSDGSLPRARPTGRPSSVKRCAMKRAWPTLTQ